MAMSHHNDDSIDSVSDDISSRVSDNVNETCMQWRCCTDDDNSDECIGDIRDDDDVDDDDCNDSDVNIERILR